MIPGKGIGPMGTASKWYKDWIESAYDTHPCQCGSTEDSQPVRTRTPHKASQFDQIPVFMCRRCRDMRRGKWKHLK